MKTENVMTLAVTSASDKLEGLIITGDIAESYMDVYDNHILSRARTQYKNIVETLNGTLLAGNEHAYFAWKSSGSNRKPGCDRRVHRK